MRNLKWMGIATIAVVLSGATPSLADQPATANSLQLGVGFRYGFSLDDEKPSRWGPGLGANAGLTLPNAVYVGGVFDYFFGASQEEAGVKATAHVWQLMGEGGYDIGLANLVIRPKVGAGYATTSAEVCAGDTPCLSNSSGDFALAPGVSLLLFFPRVRISTDLRYDLIFAEKTAKALILTAGVGF